MARIELEHVTKRYPGGVPAVNDLTPDIPDGDFRSWSARRARRPHLRISRGRIGLDGWSWLRRLPARRITGHGWHTSQQDKHVDDLPGPVDLPAVACCRRAARRCGATRMGISAARRTARVARI
jgi:hypothetical protein